MDIIKYKPIGVIHSPFKEPKGTPIQPSADKDTHGTVEVFSEYAQGLKDVQGFSHIILIFHFHMSKKASLLAKPYMDDQERGIFAIRGPSRPNPIGISTVRLIRVEKNLLHIKELDIVDGTPLLDIKPFVPKFDNRDAEKTGWLKRNVSKLKSTRDDGSFSDNSL